MIDLLAGWVTGTYPILANEPGINPAFAHVPEFVPFFISSRANKLIDAWLMSKKLAALTPISPNKTGCIMITRERVEHVNDSRTSKDMVVQAGVIELLGQLFVHGHPKYAPNPSPKYPRQLLMFDPLYKAKDPAAKGESPVAALEFCGDYPVCLRLETAYWAKPAKVGALDKTALKK